MRVLQGSCVRGRHGRHLNWCLQPNGWGEEEPYPIPIIKGRVHFMPSREMLVEGPGGVSCMWCHSLPPLPSQLWKRELTPLKANLLDTHFLFLCFLLSPGTATCILNHRKEEVILFFWEAFKECSWLKPNIRQNQIWKKCNSVHLNKNLTLNIHFPNVSINLASFF